jgi:hypothetical protein
VYWELRNSEMFSCLGNTQRFMKHEGSLLCSQESATSPYPEPNESSPRCTKLVLYDPFLLFLFQLSLSLGEDKILDPTGTRILTLRSSSPLPVAIPTALSRLLDFTGGYENLNWTELRTSAMWHYVFRSEESHNSILWIRFLALSFYYNCEFSNLGILTLLYKKSVQRYCTNFLTWAFGPLSARTLFSEDITLAILFKETASKNWNLIIIVWDIFEKISVPCLVVPGKGPLVFELEFSYLLETSLWWTNS